MPKIKYSGYWSAIWHTKYNIPKGFLLIKYEDIYRKRLGKSLLKLDSLQTNILKKLIEKKPGKKSYIDYMRPIDIVMEYHAKKRTLDQNALMWTLYEIEANEMNGGQKGHREQMVTPDDLYYGDLREWGEREEITTRRKYLSYYMSEYRIIEAVILEDGKEISVEAYINMKIASDDTMRLRVIRGTSKLDTKDMSLWIEGQFNRLAWNGVAFTDTSEIKNYWIKWKQHLNDEKIIIHDDILTIEEYRTINPICEACSKDTRESGHIAHIKAIGIGSNRNKNTDRNYSSNLLMLCNDCHIGLQHMKGWMEFQKKYNHLVYKVTKALNKEYEPIPEIEEYYNPANDNQDELDIF